MPYNDETRRREYDKEYKRKRRSQSLTKKGIDKRLTEIEVETAKDLRDLLNEVIAETRDSTSLDVEKKLRIKLRAVEIGLRVIEVTDHERRIAALEEKGNEPAPITN